MNKLYKNMLFMVLMFVAGFGFAQTATDFNVNDCNGTNRHLFAELDAGKVVVMSMVHPCTSCAGPTKSAQNIVNSYATTNPGKVIMFLTDDVGDTQCPSLLSWANQFSISGIPVLSDATIKQSSYGSSGMPKIVVLGGGSAHLVYFNQNNGLNATNFTAAINTAIAASGIPVQEKAIQLSVFPNPAQNKLEISFTLNASSKVGLEIYNMLGSKVKSIPVEKMSSGEQILDVDLESLNNGVYFLKLIINDQTSLQKFNVSR